MKTRCATYDEEMVDRTMSSFTQHSLLILYSISLIFISTGCDSLRAREGGGLQKWVVLEKSTSTVLEQCSRASPVAQVSRIPSSLEILNLEQSIHHLRRLESKLCCLLKGKIPHPDRYYRQYIGLLYKDEYVIYINAFLREESGWRQEPVVSCDGGSEYWGAIFNPRTGRFSDLAINGTS